MPDPEQSLTVRQIAKRSGIGEHTIRGTVRSGKLKARYPGERRTWARIQWSDFVKWVESRVPDREMPPEAQRMLGIFGRLRPH